MKNCGQNLSAGTITSDHALNILKEGGGRGRDTLTNINNGTASWVGELTMNCNLECRNLHSSLLNTPFLWCTPLP